jgi:hypothetical protein
MVIKTIIIIIIINILYCAKQPPTTGYIYIAGEVKQMQHQNQVGLYMVQRFCLQPQFPENTFTVALNIIATKQHLNSTSQISYVTTAT